ncbi:hypothetical protein KJ966_06400 [bacterium]|nr:hypothetical protein [bacterium]
MNNQKEKSEILLKTSAKGFSITIFGKKEEDGQWNCAIERNEITLSEIPISEHVHSLGEQRSYEKTDFKFSFEEAFQKVDLSEWFLCRPDKIHVEFSDFVIEAFNSRMEEYDLQFPSDSPMESFIRENRIKEWKAMADMT